jgi:phosphatidylserine/phosphatidylglycerophosphate/cardiolipin synthase-like enzyme
MTAAFPKLSDADLRELANALKSRRVSEPYSELQVNRVLSPKSAQNVTSSLQELAAVGFDEQQIAAALELLLQDRSDGRKIEPTIDLVTSGPEAPGIANRDTAVVVRELFAHAQKSADRMKRIPDLDVKLFLDIARPDNDTTSAKMLVSRYAQRFRDSQWPKDCRLPAVFYDPRSVAENKRSSLHAKCVVVDAEQVFVSSANFTKAAQERNIEVGLRIRSHHLAYRISHHFHLLNEHKLVVRAI